MKVNGFCPEGTLIYTEENAAFLTEAGLARAKEEGRILEGRATLCDQENNLHVELADGLVGLIPRAEALLDDSARSVAILSRVGRPVCFQVIGSTLRDGKRFPLLSRRAAQAACFSSYVRGLTPGDVIGARITHLTQFGAFADIGCGLVSLLPVDSISVSRIPHPAERFHVGQRIRAAVRATAPEGFRITLSHRELLGTWEENAARFEPGMTVAGIVRSVEPYGVFVELTPNLAGLAEPREGVREGDTAAVYIKSILPEKMKVKLAIVDVFPRSALTCDPVYYIDRGHLTVWRYSPESCPRFIGTDFTAG